MRFTSVRLCIAIGVYSFNRWHIRFSWSEIFTDIKSRGKSILLERIETFGFLKVPRFDVTFLPSRTPSL